MGLLSIWEILKMSNPFFTGRTKSDFDDAPFDSASFDKLRTGRVTKNNVFYRFSLLFDPKYGIIPTSRSDDRRISPAGEENRHIRLHISK
jgi:hypothetical protein